ncbi:MAG: LexA family protein [Bacteroidia bacterium]
MKPLHLKQSQILEFLKRNFGNPLVINDLYEELGIKSPGILYHHLDQLEKKGYLKRNPNNSKDYSLMESAEDPVTYVNNYGKAQCGPNGTFPEESPIERVPITSAFLKFPAAEAFMVVANGDSMEPKIHEGDKVIARRTSDPASGDIVVCVHENEVKIKKFIRIGYGAVLQSLNKEYPLVAINSDTDFQIVGVVKNVLSTF